MDIKEKNCDTLVLEKNTRLIIAYRGGDSDAGEELVKGNMPLV